MYSILISRRALVNICLAVVATCEMGRTNLNLARPICCCDGFYDLEWPDVLQPGVHK